MWATPTMTRMEPEELIRDFLSVTGLKIGKLRVDNEFASSSSFEAFCKRRGITLCPSVAYNHTMQARAEGAVRICKEHVRCLLKASNAPARFWPFALLQFCRVYNYWPTKNSPPPWEKMKESSFSFDLERDLHPWGCYMAAKLPREHLLVQEDTTHADRGLEGAFMGWHDTTPVAWMYSFKLQRVIRVSDPIFHHDDEYPFMDPSVVLTPGSLTADHVKQMHEQDISTGESLEDLMSAALTQQQ